MIPKIHFDRKACDATHKYVLNRRRFLAPFSPMYPNQAEKWEYFDLFNPVTLEPDGFWMPCGNQIGRERDGLCLDEGCKCGPRVAFTRTSHDGSKVAMAFFAKPKNKLGPDVPTDILGYAVSERGYIDGVREDIALSYLRLMYESDSVERGVTPFLHDGFDGVMIDYSEEFFGAEAPFIKQWYDAFSEFGGKDDMFYDPDTREMCYKDATVFTYGYFTADIDVRALMFFGEGETPCHLVLDSYGDMPSFSESAYDVGTAIWAIAEAYCRSDSPRDVQPTLIFQEMKDLVAVEKETRNNTISKED